MAVVEQAGGIAIRRDAAGPSVLLVRANRDPSLWICPKGHIEPGESAIDCAVRETREEAGVVGDAIASVGAPLVFEFGGQTIRVQYFLSQPTGEAPSLERREKVWVPAGEAMQRLSFDNLRALLREALTTA